MKLRLRIATAQSAPFDWEFTGYQFRAGRDPDCQLSFVGDDCRAVSWQHAKFVLYADGALLSDLGSSNGTFVNSVQIRQETKLRVGDLVLRGQSGPMLTVAAYFDEGAAAAPARAAPAPGIEVAAPSGTPLVASASASPRGVAERSRSGLPGPAGPAATSPPAPTPSPLDALRRRGAPLVAGLSVGAVLVALLSYVWISEDDETPRKESAKKEPATASATASSGATSSLLAAASPSGFVVPAPSSISPSSTGPSASAPPPMVPPPPLPPPLPVAPALALDQIVQQSERGVVWIGVQKPDESGTPTRYALFAGWVAAPSLVVTTAQVVRDLETLRKEQSWPLFVACERAAAPDLPIRALTAHPLYQPSATDDSWVHFNVGVIAVDGALPTACRPAVEADLRSTIDLDRGRTAVVGWSIPEESKQRPAANSDRPFLRENCDLSGPFPARPEVRFPRRELRNAQLPEGMSGSPVFGLRGAVVGTLFQLNRRNYVISSMALADLLR